MILPTGMPGPQLGSEQRQLLKLFGTLSSEDKASLLAFAEFLASRTKPDDGGAGPQTPAVAARPAQESVVAAMRRLSQGYAMLDRSAVFHDAAALMAAHTLQGKPAAEVIDELEALFDKAYQDYLGGFADP